MERAKVEKVNGSIGSILMGDVPSLNKIKPKIIDQYGVEENINRLSFDEQIEVIKLEREALESEKKQSIEDKLKDAEERGYQAGFVVGKGEGYNESMDTNLSKLELITHLVSGVQAGLKGKSSEIEKVIVDTVSLALTQVYLAQTKLNPQLVQKIITICLSELPIYAKNIVIRCSDEDYKVIEECGFEHNVKPLSSLSSGEIVVDSDSGIVQSTAKSISDDFIQSILPK